jgi:predicted DNA binding CopG/RHH family protein
MRKEYDFTNGTPNPYLEKMKKQITIRLDIQTIDYFKTQSQKTGIPYQQLINFYLRDCANNNKELIIA